MLFRLGTGVSVTNSGSSTAATLNFTIPRGDTGTGIASGGTTNQALIKSSNSDYATTWSSVVRSDASLVTGSTSISNAVFLSQTSYDALTVKDSTTLYIIV